MNIPVLMRFLQAQWRLARMESRASGASRELLASVRRALRLRASTDERAWISRIEALRRELRSCDTIITHTIRGLPAHYAEPQGEPTASGRRVTETIGAVCRRASRQYLWCLLLFRLIRDFRLAACLELGTSLGISGAYQAAALNLNGAGRLVTLEGDEVLASLAERHFRTLGVDRARVHVGSFEETLERAAADLAPVDFVFFDGPKEKPALLHGIERIFPSLAPRAILVFDDIHWSAEMTEAWRVIEGDERMKITLDLRALGVCLVDRELGRKERYEAPIG
jgi:predicted O-methyltransferase YrrM